MILDYRLGWLLSSFCFHPLTPITVWNLEGLGNLYFSWPLKPHLLLIFSNASSLVPRRSRLSQTWTLQGAVMSSRETLSHITVHSHSFLDFARTTGQDQRERGGSGLYCRTPFENELPGASPGYADCCFFLTYHFTLSFCLPNR